ncbi:hypothetical protein HPB50_007307 [Hyalomma asiaticum]|uniref:Uncharacterized protein n=1 Tax=Hyalomma asiaticum TaxID=266040 RepID=A0ACB7SEP2_HYAAI|nr:hypothetical protein HPB50_007307 [Hyalomma asiaticum]
MKNNCADDAGSCTRFRILIDAGQNARVRNLTATRKASVSVLSRPVRFYRPQKKIKIRSGGTCARSRPGTSQVVLDAHDAGCIVSSSAATSRFPTLLWFVQVEATFDLHHISDISPFCHLLCNLSPEVAQEVADVIAAPLNDAPYQRLKQSILDRTTTSESARLKAPAFINEELGDGRPSQLLRRPSRPIS